jgi:hypothetical protein
VSVTERETMGLTDYTISDKRYWMAGREYERKRIVKILMDYAPHLTTSGLMEQINGEEEKDDEQTS